MKICFIGKYPPIEGGVSSQNYWLARGLGERGHEIFIVTNAYEVSADYRIKLSDRDIDEYQPDGVIVYNTNPFIKSSYIPYANPFVTKLSSIATKIIKDFDIDVIYSHYFEPYCVAGYIAKTLTSKPLIVRHAGSDISRLYNDSNLNWLYTEILQNSDLVISPPSTAEVIKSLGIKTEIDSSAKSGVNNNFFSPNISPIDWNDFIEDYKNEPVILMYGKAGETKGSVDILHILKYLRSNFKFVYITSPNSFSYLKSISKELSIENNVKLVSFVSNIEIARFIKASSIVCFLERNFPIPIHSPVIPREVMAVGTCLVISEEIFNKQYYKEKLNNFQNIVCINPLAHVESAKVIDKLLTDQGKREEIGYGGRKIFEDINKYEDFIVSYEKIFKRFF